MGDAWTTGVGVLAPSLFVCLSRFVEIKILFPDGWKPTSSSIEPNDFSSSTELLIVDFFRPDFGTFLSVRLGTVTSSPRAASQD